MNVGKVKGVNQVTKNRLEHDFSSILRGINHIYYLKLQVNIHAHTPSPADYLVLSKIRRILVECKNCENNAFAFDRMTQLLSLVEFEKKHSDNFSYVLISFWEGRKDKSQYFLIPIKTMIHFMDNIGKKSANKKDFNEYFLPLSYEDLVDVLEEGY